MPSLLDFIQALQDAEYNRSASFILSAISRLTTGQGSELQQALVSLEEMAKDLVTTSQFARSDEYSRALANFRRLMNDTETLILEYAPEIELSGAEAARRSTTARMFYGTSQDMINAGIDPVDAASMSYFMDVIKNTGVPFSAPAAQDLVTLYTQSAAFIEKMAKWGDGYASIVNDSVISGISNGWGALKIARHIRDLFQSVPLNAAYNLTRTLQLQSYRDASARMEQINGAFIEKKIRIAALDGRTCPTCIALHGTEVPLGKPIKDHYSGRCDAIYIPAGGEMPEFMQYKVAPGQREFIPWQTGEDWFAGLSEGQQRGYLGPGKFELYNTGEIKLSDIVGEYDDPVFGEMPIVKPLWALEGYDSYAQKLDTMKEGDE